MIAMISPAMAEENSARVAILRSYRGVLVNGAAPRTTAPIFPGDIIETQAQSPAARIELIGSTVEISPETIVQFESDQIRLDHGSLSVNTYRPFRVRVGCVTINPVNADWAQYDVSDVSGIVTVIAVKGGVNVDSERSSAPAGKNDDSGRINIHEGEQISREEKCAGVDTKVRIAAKGPILDSPYVQWPASGLIGGITCWVLCRGDDSISPSSPSRRPPP